MGLGVVSEGLGTTGSWKSGLSCCHWPRATKQPDAVTTDVSQGDGALTPGGKLVGMSPASVLGSSTVLSRPDLNMCAFPRCGFSGEGKGSRPTGSEVSPRLSAHGQRRHVLRLKMVGPPHLPDPKR